jgi:hypothetical protein
VCSAAPKLYGSQAPNQSLDSSFSLSAASIEEVQVDRSRAKTLRVWRGWVFKAAGAAVKFSTRERQPLFNLRTMKYAVEAR